MVTSFAGCSQSSKTANVITPKDSAVSKESLALHPGKFFEKFEQGIDFIATGNEPFWSLEIDFEKTMHFKMVGGFEITTPAVEGVKAMDANVIRYHANTEKSTLIVQVQKLECINDM